MFRSNRCPALSLSDILNHGMDFSLDHSAYSELTKCSEATDARRWAFQISWTTAKSSVWIPLLTLNYLNVQKQPVPGPEPLRHSEPRRGVQSWSARIQVHPAEARDRLPWTDSCFLPGKWQVQRLEWHEIPNYVIAYHSTVLLSYSQC